MIKLVFSGKCVGCTVCDLIIENKKYPKEYTVHCMHEEACERMDDMHRNELFYGPGGEGRRNT